MSSLLITGSQGLIGKALCKRLKADFYCVKVFDNSFPVDHPDYGDITCRDTIQKRMKNCRGIVHMAAVSRVIWGEQQPEKCWQTNVIGTQNVLKCAYLSLYQPWVIYASSREVYGQQQQFPVTESSPLQPLNIYARSKVVAEAQVQHYQSRGLKTSILRFSSVYGRSYDHADRVVPAFCRAAALGEPLRIEGAKNTFDFTHVDDVVEGILKVIDQLERGYLLPPIHLTTGQPTTLEKLAQLACKASQKQAPFIAAPPRNFDVSTFYGDPALAREQLGWTPQTTIGTGVKELVTDFLKQNNEAKE